MVNKFLFLLLTLCIIQKTPQIFAASESQMKDQKRQFEVDIKLLNGKELPRYLKDSEATHDGEKYFLISIVNNSKKIAFFDLIINAKGNPSVGAKLPIMLLPPSNNMRTPIYYLYYIGSPALFESENALTFDWEIENLYFE